MILPIVLAALGAGAGYGLNRLASGVRKNCLLSESAAIDAAIKAGRKVPAYDINQVCKQNNPLASTMTGDVAAGVLVVSLAAVGFGIGRYVAKKRI